jgi:hypothetical protein
VDGECWASSTRRKSGRVRVALASERIRAAPFASHFCLAARWWCQPLHTTNGAKRSQSSAEAEALSLVASATNHPDQISHSRQQAGGTSFFGFVVLFAHASSEEKRGGKTGAACEGIWDGGG